jgi:hypothetical protein
MSITGTSDFDSLIQRAEDAVLKPYDQAGIGATVTDAVLIDATDLPMQQSRRYTLDVSVKVRVHVTRKAAHA